MKSFNNSNISLVLIGFVATFLVGGRSANADFIAGTPTNLGPIVNTSDQFGHPSISRDGLSLYFTSFRPGGSGDYGDFWVTTRETVLDPWGTPVCLGPLTVHTSSNAFPSANL